LQQIRRDFPLGNYPLRIEETRFKLADYREFLQQEKRSIEKFQGTRDAAFAAELANWKRDGQLTYQEEDSVVAAPDGELLPDGITSIDSPVSGSVWKLLVQQGDRVIEGDAIMILESMKMEIEIHATQAGEVRKVIRQQGQSVTAGQTLLWVSEGE
jgi:urea carboxylase